MRGPHPHQDVRARDDEPAGGLGSLPSLRPGPPNFGRGDDTVGNPHRAQIYQFELFELILALKLGKQFSVEQFEATVSQSTVPSPPLKIRPDPFNFSPGDAFHLSSLSPSPSLSPI